MPEEKKNLVVYDLRYYKEQKVWSLSTGGVHVWADGEPIKTWAVSIAAADMNDFLNNFGQESELRVHTKTGKFSFARTYGHDPKSPG